LVRILQPLFKSILFPIDSSVQSTNSLDMTLFISKLLGSQVTLIHVVSNELLTIPGLVYSPIENYEPVSAATGQFPRVMSLPQTQNYVLPEEVIREVTDTLELNGQTILSDGAAQFTKEGVSVKEKLVKGGDTAQTIIDEAETGNYDLILMGNSANEEKELDLHLGSVAAKVSSAAKIPILIVRQKKQISKILIPVDGSKNEEFALQKAYLLAKASGSKVVLLHVQEASLLNLRPEIKEFGIEILESRAKMFVGIPLEQKLVSGDPAKVIIKTAQETNSDLIVISAGGHGVKGFFLGRVSDHVLRHATIPVLLAR
jgi:nucleotide-binding universal stress UspA family protein